MKNFINMPAYGRQFAFILVGLLSMFLSGCEGNVTESYDREFGIGIPEPATGVNPFWMIFSEECTTDFMYNEDLGVEVGTLREGVSHWTTTAYLPADDPEQRNLYVMYLNTRGTELKATYEGRTKTHRLIKAIPAGNISVLTVVVTHSDTTDDNTLPYLQAAQSVINQQHSDYATTRGWAPIVEFSFTNQTVNSAGFHITRDTPFADVMDLLERKRISVDGYDFLVLINADPSMSEGGLGRINAARPFYIYIGNFGNWTSALTQQDLTSIAGAAYHHEVGHYWGWDHDWSPCSNESDFITNPALFGWTDTDGDNIPEIIDPTPYGRTP